MKLVLSSCVITLRTLSQRDVSQLTGKLHFQSVQGQGDALNSEANTGA